MSANVIDDPNTSNTFKAIIRSLGNVKEIMITEDEYLALKELRRMRIEQRHTMIQFAYRDGKMLCYSVKPNFEILAK